MNDKAMINAFGQADFSRLSAAEQALVARRERVLGPAYRLFYERPVEFVRGEGTWLFDRDGEAYLDAYNNVASVGHANPRVVAAMTDQAARLNTHTRYLNEGLLDYAERLVATLPSELSQVTFTCTGSEANDLAWRVARARTGGTGIIVTSLAYHGVTDAVAAYSPSLGAASPLGAHVRTVSAPSLYRQRDDVGARFAADVRAAIADLQRHGLHPAMLIVDTIFSSDGVLADPPGFLTEAAAAIREAGGLFVADEVQPGFGRTGDAMWGFARHGLVPDLVTMGKPMGNGYPVAALVGRPDVLAPFGQNIRYFNTYGGTPVAIAAAGAVLDEIEERNLMLSAQAVGRLLRGDIAAIGNAAIGDVRGAGLFIGVEIVGPDGEPDAVLTGRIVNGMRERRVLISASGPSANVLKIRPPMVFDAGNAEQFTATLAQVLKENT
ncbi:4-aminobutyrate aminotransferase [Devosia riboflavina]|uniref:4-aminobutyrate aminotransferase n=1 Tax=Devosia riboflavina TaxID=46914 RepID=A0A087LZG8_9HYPH|nr:aspartate aminotransferase family protein [Devosia riboflavina]KFL30021.1 4-aminobutyrate aminotransferase [Devosia riboflavina]